MSKRMRIGSWLIICGCILFFIYGAGAAILGEPAAAYQYKSAYKSDFYALPEQAREFCALSVVTLSLLGAGLALCSTALFWLGLFKGIRLAFLAAFIGGAIGLIGLISIHFDQRAWILFIIDNVCLNFIGIGITVAGKELRDFIIKGNA